MDNLYNLYNFEAPFKKYLLAGINSPLNNAEGVISHEMTQKVLTNVSVKNYLSDLRHFFGWLTLLLKSQPVTSHQPPTNDYLFLVSLLTPTTIKEYKAYLIDNKIPLKTVNRRLSTLRKFCSFCISQGWMKENPAKQIQNVVSSIKKQELNHEQTLSDYKDNLIQEKLDYQVITNYLNDVQEYLSLTI